MLISQLQLFSDHRSPNLKLNNIRTIFLKFLPEIKMQINSLINDTLKFNKFILEQNNLININTLSLIVLIIIFNHFLFNQILISKDREFFLNIWLISLSNHHLIQCLKLILKLFSLNISIKHMESSTLRMSFESINHNFFNPSIPKLLISFFILVIIMGQL